MNSLPFVSIIIPCRNEEKFIGMCIDSIIANDYPKDRLEILVVDGMSDDNTRTVVEGYCRRYQFISLLENPQRITPCAFNIGVKRAKGEVVIRMDAHSEYFNDYIKETITYLEKTGADNVGGIRITRTIENTLTARLISFVTSCPFGVGLAKYRFSKEGAFVDTVPNGAFRKELFDRIGYFDEKLIRNQDNEFNARIIEHGGKVFLSPTIKSYYYNQSTLKGLLRQAFRAGMWNVYTFKANPTAFRWRHFIPFIFVTAFLGLGLFTPIHYFARLGFFLLIGLYGGIAGVSSLKIGIREGMKYIWVLPIIFFFYHVCYGLGTWGGLLKLLFGWDSSSDNRRKIKI